MNQEKKSKINSALKEVFKDIKIKYSLRVCNHSKIILTIRESTIDFIGNWEKKNEKVIEKDCLQVNQYWIDSHFSDEVCEILKKIDDAMRSADYYDRSDAMTDYFDTAYYYSINIGEWCKPYKLLDAK